MVSLGASQGDNIALMMLNRPAYVAFWLGCSKVSYIMNYMMDYIMNSIMNNITVMLYQE